MDYHQLGIIAQERQQFDQAEARYRKALEIRERLGHPPLMVNSLAQMGVLRRRQRGPEEAVGWLGQAFAIAAAYEMRVGMQILVHLARLMEGRGKRGLRRRGGSIFGLWRGRLRMGSCGEGMKFGGEGGEGVRA